MRTALLSSFCLLLTCLLAACGGGDAGDPPADPARAPAETPTGDASEPPADDGAAAEPEPDAGDPPPADPSDPPAPDPSDPTVDPETTDPQQPADPDAGDPAAEPDIAMPEPVGDPATDRIIEFIRTAEIDRAEPAWRESLPAPPEDVTFEPGRAYYWHLTTDRGDLKVRLRPAAAPRHVANLIYLTKLGYYDDLTFHRIMGGFMAQGGCPRGDGYGNPGYSLDGEFTDGIAHDTRGQLSTANTGPGTDGSQFFLTFAPAPHLDSKHTIFGAVVDGRSTLDALERLGTPTGKPTEDVVIESATIEVK